MSKSFNKRQYFQQAEERGASWEEIIYKDTARNKHSSYGERGMCVCCEIRELCNKQCGVIMEGPQKSQRGVQMSLTQRSLPHQPSQLKTAVLPTHILSNILYFFFTALIKVAIIIYLSACLFA